MSLDLLGAESPTQPVVHRHRPRLSLAGSLLSIGAGVVGSVLWRKHPVLGFLGASAVAGNVHAAATGDQTWREAGERMGRHVVATAGSLALPAHPALGYVAAAFAADLLLDDKGGGVFSEWAHHIAKREPEVIDVTPADAKTLAKPPAKKE